VYQQWRLVNVQDAIKRWGSFHRDHPAYQLTRRTFFEVFSDYGVTTDDGSFLSVPLGEFSRFDPQG